MNYRLQIRCALIVLLAMAGQCAAAELVVLVPMMAGDKPVMRAGPKGEPQAPILKRAANDALAKALALEATRGATKFMLGLDEQAQRLTGAATPGPTYLLRSNVESGFTRRGFWLSEANSNVAWHADPYVEMGVDKQSVDEGTFEENFAHEVGHVLLRRVLPKLPAGFSRSQHSSLAITDYPTAFDEGFAIHFQVLARRLTQNAKLIALDRGPDFKPFVGYWQSNIDRSLRIRGVRDNLFIHQQLPALLAVGDATSNFDLTHFKNGQQMLSSEGVVATLFYHLLVQANDTTATLTERYKSLLASANSLNGQRLNAGTPFFLSLVQTHIQRVPDAKSKWIGTVMNLTYGATASNTVLREMTKLSALGQEGNAVEYQAALKQSRASLAAVIDQVTRNPQRLGAAVGAELWLAFKESDTEQWINLNTAEKTSLEQVVGFESIDADLLLADRWSRGPFASVEDFAVRRKAPPLLRSRLKAANELAVKLGGMRRD